MDQKCCVVAYAFGTPSSILANRRIAEIAEARACLYDAYIYTQLDIQLGGKTPVPVVYTKEVPGEPPPTLRIARGAVRKATDEGVTFLVVVAAEPHLWRAYRDTCKAVAEAGVDMQVISAEHEICSYDEEEWFCEDSTQPRTQNREAWDERENILKKMPWWLYKFIAK